MSDWLLVEQFGGTDEPSIIAIGSVARTFTPLRRVIRSQTHRKVIETALETLKESARPAPLDFSQAGTRYIFTPLTDFFGYTPAVLVHYASEHSPVAPPPECGAWHFNVTASSAHGSNELLDMYRVPEEKRQTGRPLFEAFERLVGDDAEAVAKLIEQEPGVTHQAIEKVQTDDGALWIAHYSCRFVQRGDEILLHGVTRKVGDADRDSTDALTTAILQAHVLPQVYRAVVEPRTGNILRNLDGFPPRAKPLGNVLDVVDPESRQRSEETLRAASEGDFVVIKLNDITVGGNPAKAELYPMSLAGVSAILVVTYV